VIGWGLIALLFALPAPAIADIYRWQDARGVMHFSNQPPPDGTVLIEKIEEAPYDAEADRQRIEEERRLRLERQKLEVEERKAKLDAREREADLQLEQANRRLEEARQLEEQARAGGTDDCDDDYYSRHGYCGGYAVYGGRYYRYYHGRPGSPDLYRRYYRDNNSLYYKDPHKPGRLPLNPHPVKPGKKPVPPPGAPQSIAKPGKSLQAADEIPPKPSGQPQRKQPAPGPRE
jgi:hypothetical protein